MCDWVCFGCSVWCQVPIHLWNHQTFNWPKRVVILGYGSGNARKGWQDRALCHDHWWKLTLWCLVFCRWVWCVIKFLILCAFWLQEPPKEVVRIIEKMGGHLRDPMKEVWEHRLPIKLSRQCLWCIQITRISFDFLWMHSWWYHHWWFVIGMLRSFEEPQGSKQKMSGLHTEVQEEVAWHQRLWGRH